jgi:selenocysteine lyase/cysteine desulfurase
VDPSELRAQFPVLERLAYLNAGTDGPVPRAAAEAARAEIDRELAEGRISAHFERRSALQEALRAQYAALVGAEPDDIALQTSTSEGLGRVMAGLDLGPTDEILTSDEEHPGLLGPLAAARARGATVRFAPLATLDEAITDATTVVACSHVGWVSGLTAPAALAECGVPVILDGAQGAGAVPVDVRALGCAAYASAGQKWLCGADGTGFLYLEPAFCDRLRAIAPSYVAFEDANQGLDSPLKAGARCHDTPAVAAEVLAFSAASVRVLADAGWGTVHGRGVHQAAALAARLAAAGRTVAPRDATTLVAWEDDDPTATRDRLADVGVVVRNLPGRPLLRASVGAWTSDDDLDRLLAAL